MTVMSMIKWTAEFQKDTSREHEKEAIHSGHFMVSEFEAEDQDDDDEVSVPVPEEENESKSVLQTGKVPQVSSYIIKPNIRQQLFIETSLTKLFQCMSLAYRQKLTSPKWNMFKGIRLRWKEKIRLNNVIWRCWHIQFVNRKNTLVCQFASPLDIYTHNKPEAIVMEGKYWKRRLNAVTAEYKKWRMFYRNKLLGKYSAHDMLFGLEGIDWQCTGSVKGSNMLVDDDYMDFVSDTLFTTISANQPFAFPDSREIARGAGLADFIQPSLVQLQPNLDDFMDLEPFQELLQTTKLEGYGADSCMNKPSLDYFSGEPSWGHGPPFHSGAGAGNSLMRQVIAGPSSAPSSSMVSTRAPPAPPPPPMVIDSTSIIDEPPRMSSQLSNVDSNTVTAGQSSIIRRGPLHMKQPSSIAPIQISSPSMTPLPSEPPSYQPQLYSPGALSNMTIHRPPITTTTNTYFQFKGSSKPARSTPPIGTHLRRTPDQTPLLNEMLTGVSYQYMKTEDSQNQAPEEMPYILHSNVPPPVRMNDNSYIYSPPSVVSGNSNDGSQVVMPLGSSSILPLVSQNTQLMMPAVQQVSSMGFAGASTTTTTSPDSPVNSESLSPVNMASPLSSPSPSKPTHHFKDHRRTGHINAEQMRRCNIKNGFDTLHAMLPQVAQSPNTKVSKAALLQKGAEYIRQLRSERSQLEQEIDALRQQVEDLNSAISVCQEKLPATGAPVSRQKSGKMMDMFKNYVRLRTLENWKFWILSLICEPLLMTFADFVSTSSPDELYNTTLQWVDQHCTLVQLRPIVLNALRNLCTTTEVLAEPQMLPIEARNAVQDHTNSKKR